MEMKSLIARITSAALPVVTATIVTAQAQPNSVISLNGTTAYVSIPSAPELQNPNGLTIEGWLNTSQNSRGGGGGLLNKSDGLDGRSQRTYEVKWSPDGTIIFAVYFALPVGPNQPHFAEIQAPFRASQWTHIAGTYSTESGLKLYTNGVLAAQSTTYDGNSFLGLPVRQTTQPILIGGHPSYPANSTLGSADEIRIWNTARSGDQIARNMSCKLIGTEPNLVAYWNFDDGTARDLTGKGNHGTFVGGAATAAISESDPIHAGCGFTPAWAALATPVVVNGFLVGVTVTDGGLGYTNVPTVRIIRSGSGAQAEAVVSNGVISAVNVLTAGSGYIKPPVVVIAPPYIPQPEIAITALLFGPIATPVMKVELSRLSPYDRYQLEFKTEVAGVWSSLGAPFIPTAAANTQYANGVGREGFFRVRYVP